MEASPSDAPAVAQDQPADVTSAPPVEGTSAVESAEFFSENFDPNTLPPELAPAYKQMQGAWTKKTQELAEQRKEAENAVAFIQALQSEDQREAALQQLAEAIGPEAVLEALGYAPEADDDDLMPVDPGEEALRRIEEIEQQRQAAEAEAAQNAQLQAIGQHVDSEFAQIAKDSGVEDLPDDVKDLVVRAALSGAPDEQGRPQIRQVYDQLNAIWEARQKDWVQSKQAQRAGTGQPGVEQFDINNPDETIKRMAAIMDANS